ncbi:hypothetical protein AMTRI_Chr04g187360 [Amborella trichopoda]
MKTILLELLVEPCLLIKKPGSAFKNEQWSAIEHKFNVNLGMNLRMDAFKNKLRTWSKNYKTSNPLAKNFKGKSFEYWKEQSIIVGNDFADGVDVRTAAQLERDIDDDVEDVQEMSLGLDDDDDGI